MRGDYDEDFDGEPRRPWQRLLLALVAIVAIAIVGALIFSTIRTTQQRDVALDRRQYSYDVMLLARELDATMGKAEATLGRFVISGDKNIGRTYADGWRRASTLIEKLADVTADEPAQRIRVAELRRAYRVRGDELGAIALRTNYGQNPQALSKYYDAGKAPSLTRLDGLLERIITAERVTLDARARTADASVARTNMLTRWISALGLLLALGALTAGWSAWQARMRSRDEERRNEDLEYAVAARTAELSEANELLRAEMATRETTEERLRQAQKMEAVGQLTGGIAHDFNNMLSVVIGGIELAKRRLGGGQNDVGAIDRHLDNAMEGANRAAVLTKRLLAFARAEPLLPAATDTDTLIANMVDMLDRTLGDTIEVVIQCGAGWPVFADAHQLENALLNLAVNARDAMESGGMLTIATGDVTLSDGEVGETPPGDYVRIAVSDTGTGMTPEVQRRIFEPFFTTKQVGKGTGLGLSQIFGFLRQSGGGIAVESAPDAGTTVSVYLPRFQGKSSAVRPVSAAVAPSHASRHAGTVTLVIEDDVRVLAATVAALSELGFEAIPCLTAAEVPQLLRERRDIGLIVSDVLMPGVTGPELVAAIRVAQPDMPVLFVTGFAGDISDSEAFGGHDVLRKPFTLAGLGDAVDRVLDRSGGPQAEAA